jgi:hypothetical protein
VGHVSAQRLYQRNDNRAKQCDLNPANESHGGGLSEMLWPEKRVDEIDQQPE